MRRVLLVVAALAIAACAIERVAGSGGPGILQHPFTPMATTCGSTSPSPTAPVWGSVNIYSCSETIWVRNASSRPDSDIKIGINVWHPLLGANGLPVYVFRTGGGSYSIFIFDSTPANHYVCGKVPQASNGRIALFYSSTKSGCGSESNLVAIDTATHSQVGALIAHELGHALNFFKHFAQGKDTAGVRLDTIVGRCVMAVPQSLNTSLCENDRETVYYQYNLNPHIPSDPERVFVTATILSLTSITLGLDGSQTDSVTLTMPGHEPAAPAAGDSILWSLSNVTPAGAVTLSNTSSGGTTVQSHDSVGSATLTATLVSSAAHDIGWPFTTGQATITVRIPPPTSLGKSGVTATTIPLTWTNGDASATTPVQDRLTGTVSWTTVTTLAAGVSGDTITGLAQCTSYDVQVYHSRNGYSSTGDSLIGITTPPASGVCTPTNFAVSGSCTHQTINGLDYTNVPVSWTQTQFGGRIAWDIASNTTNDTTTLSIVSSKVYPPAFATVGPFPSYTGAPQTYLWVRQRNVFGATSMWVPNNSNPVVGPGGC